jgi:hypothetical protein
MANVGLLAVPEAVHIGASKSKLPWTITDVGAYCDTRIILCFLFQLIRLSAAANARLHGPHAHVGSC